MLSEASIEEFVSRGFVRIGGAVAPQVVSSCRDVIWRELSAQGILRGDPATWTESLARFPCPEGGPFVAAGTGPLLWSAYDQLIGSGRWRRHRGVGGNLFIRFPSERDPLKTKWHIDGAFTVRDEWRNNVYCKDKALLALFLFSDIGEFDAPTLLLAGSHADMARMLSPFGQRGLSFDEICESIPASTLEREVVAATGKQGDVYLCHPLLVHSPSWPHRGQNPRMLSQPGVGLIEPFGLVDDAAAFPVERAIMLALD